MTDFEEKVLRYLREHKRPTHPKTLAKLWIVSENRMARTMRDLVTMGLAEVVSGKGSLKSYRAK
jgi:hypothetical protein